MFLGDHGNKQQIKKKCIRITEEDEFWWILAVGFELCPAWGLGHPVRREQSMRRARHLGNLPVM
jgi:hypothetical protein